MTHHYEEDVMYLERGQLSSRRLEITTNQGTFRITIPKTYRVTFGPIIPEGGKGNGGTCLRIYRDGNKEDQMTVFRNVSSFRDLSIPMEEKIIEIKRDDSWEKTKDTIASRTDEQTRVVWEKVE